MFLNGTTSPEERNLASITVLEKALGTKLQKLKEQLLT